MKVLDRLPIYQEPALISARNEVVQVWRNQIVVWISVNETASPFPAILDTGHSHNASISRRHFDRWAGGPDLRQVGWAKIGAERLPQYDATVHVHRNHRGTRRLRGSTCPLVMDQGITIVPDDSPVAPRLPLLGLRAIVQNSLRLVIDGRRRGVSIRTTRW